MLSQVSAPVTSGAPASSGDPKNDLETLAESLDAVDYSRISESDCGKFALVVQRTRIRFFEWENARWVDRSEMLGPDGEVDPFLVTTRDYTGDGVKEFLVSYNFEGRQGGHQYGAIFMKTGCRWGWAKFIDYGEEVETMDLLTYDDSTAELTAWGYGPAGRADVVLFFDSESNQFNSMTLSADDVGVGDYDSNDLAEVVAVESWCELRKSAMSSDWYGQRYNWTIYTRWSDGSRTVDRMGSGYADALPRGC